MKVLIFLAAAVAYCNPVHDVLVMPSGEVCVLGSAESTTEISNNELTMLTPSGDVLWQMDTPPVRAGAAGGVLSLTARGNIFCACEEGDGYTDVLMGLYSPSGEVLSTDMISRECYDSPQAVCAVGDGMLLAWDSWSEERGIHLAVISENGTVESTEFIAGTIHPMNIAMDHQGGVTVLGVSPVASEEGVLFGLSQEGSVLWSSSYCPEDAMVIHDIAVEDSGEFAVLWGTVPVGIGSSSLILTRHSAGGGVTESETEPFQSIADISAVNLVHGEKVLIVSNSIHLVETDLNGHILTETDLPPCYAYSNIIKWCTGGYILFGQDGIEAFTSSGESVFKI